MLPPQKVGAPITARWLNKLRAAHQAIFGLKVGGNLELQWVAGAPMIRGLSPVVFMGALTPSGGIAAATGTPPTPGFATCNTYKLNGKGPWLPTGKSEVVLFDVPSTTAIGGSKFIEVYRGSDGYLHAFVEGCS